MLVVRAHAVAEKPPGRGCLNHLGHQHSDFQAKRGGRPIIQLGPHRWRHAHMIRYPSVDFEREVSVSWIMPPGYENWAVCLHLWPAASMSGGARVVWSGVRKSTVSVLFSDTVRPTASKTVTMSHHFREPCSRLRDKSASSAYSMPHTALSTHANGSCSSAPTTPSSLS